MPTLLSTSLTGAGTPVVAAWAPMAALSRTPAVAIAPTKGGSARLRRFRLAGCLRAEINPALPAAMPSIEGLTSGRRDNQLTSSR